MSGTPSLDTLLGTLTTLTGHHVAFHPTPGRPSGIAHSFDVVGARGDRYGILAVRATAIDDSHRDLYSRVAETIASEEDLRNENDSLARRIRLLSLHNTELTAINRSLSDAAYRDSLTGLYRKWHILEQLRVEIARARRYKRPLSLAVLDLRDFGSRNEQFGPRGGDALLRGFADRLRTTCRTADLLARLGGDEFAVLLPDTTMTGAAELVQRIRRRLAEEPILCGTTPVVLALHAGITSLNGEIADVTAESLLDHAAQAVNGARRAP